jgi:hypothetical protein
LNTTNLLIYAGVGAAGWILLGMPTDVKGFKDGVDKLLGKKPQKSPPPPPPPPSPMIDDGSGAGMDPYMNTPPPPSAPYPPGAFGPAPYGDPNLQFDPNQQAMTLGAGGAPMAGVDPSMGGGASGMSPTVTPAGIDPNAAAAAAVGGYPPGTIDPTTGLPIGSQTQQIYPPGVAPPGYPSSSTAPGSGAIAPGDPFGPVLPPSTAGIDTGQSQALPGGAPPWLTGPHPGYATPGDLGGPEPGLPYFPAPPAPLPIGLPPLPIPAPVPIFGGGGGWGGDHHGGGFGIPSPIFGGGGHHEHHEHHDGGHHSHYSRSMLGMAETRPKRFVNPYDPIIRHGRCVPFFKSIPELMSIDIGGVVTGLDGITLAHLVSLGTGTGVEIFPDGIDACDMSKLQNDVSRYCVKLMKNMSGHKPGEKVDMLRQIILISSSGPITPQNSIPRRPAKNMMSKIPNVPSNSPPGITGPVYRSNAGFVMPAKAASLQFNNGTNSMPPMIKSRGSGGSQGGYRGAVGQQLPIQQQRLLPNQQQQSLFFDLSH